MISVNDKQYQLCDNDEWYQHTLMGNNVNNDVMTRNDNNRTCSDARAIGTLDVGLDNCKHFRTILNIPLKLSDLSLTLGKLIYIPTIP